MAINVEKMSYQDFKDFCEQRSCDGQWNMIEAMACIDLINKFDRIKVKGLFKKKATLKAREKAWEDYKLKQQNNYQEEN